jgi:hypothetical protein
VDHDRNPVTYVDDPDDAGQDDAGQPDRQSSASYWCLLGNPKTYDVEAALSSMPIVLWNLGRIRRVLPLPGDPILVWRTLGSDGRRGLIGRGVIDGDVAFVPDNQDPFWADPTRALIVERRVPVRWWALDQPLWLDQAPDVLGALKVSRSQGLSMVVEEPEIWAEAARLVGGAPARPPSGSASRGQGWMRVVEQRLAIERAAMEAAARHYEAAGYVVEDVHVHESFDLCCRRGDEEIHVEVKGTTTEGDDVLLTSGEVRHARLTPQAALFVLSRLRIGLAGGGLVAITGDPPVIIDPWVPAEHDLEALSYRYTLPGGSLRQC